MNYDVINTNTKMIMLIRKMIRLVISLKVQNTMKSLMKQIVSLECLTHNPGRVILLTIFVLNLFCLTFVQVTVRSIHDATQIPKNTLKEYHIWFLNSKPRT